MSEKEYGPNTPRQIERHAFAQLICKGCPRGTTYYDITDSHAFLRLWESEREEDSPFPDGNLFVLSRHNKGFGWNSVHIQYDLRIIYPPDYQTSSRILLLMPTRESEFQEIRANTEEGLQKINAILCTSMGLQD